MIPTLIPFLLWTFPLATGAKSVGGGITKGGRHFSSVIQILFLNVIGSQNYVLKKNPSSLCIALRGPQVLNYTFTPENQAETRLT